jgi:hypothetical protein
MPLYGRNHCRRCSLWEVTLQGIYCYGRCIGDAPVCEKPLLEVFLMGSVPYKRYFVMGGV